MKHLPGYIENLEKIKGKGVDVVAVVAFNDAWVMSAWGKANGIKGDDIVCAPPFPPFSFSSISTPMSLGRKERVESADQCLSYSYF